MAKRLFDLMFASLGLIASSPAVLACMLAIRISSPGPSLLSQQRIGKNQALFTLYKLRTMRSDTPSRPSHLSDPDAITPLGRILRRWKLDELPQLWNVIRGDMSLVGPRPCLPTQQSLITARQKTGAFDVRPGITGLAQVRGVDMSQPEVLADLDGHYARSRSLRGDVAILMQTLGGGGLGQDPMARPHK